MNRQAYIADCASQFRKLKDMADRAVAQTDDDSFFVSLDPGGNSIATIMKHLAGNLKSRWTDFLNADGEKPDRNRDTEFETTEADTRNGILATWEVHWALAINTIAALTTEDLDRTVTIRGEPHSVPQVINRQLTHTAGHVGQIVLLARHYAGHHWQTLSIPRGRSKEFNEMMKKKGILR